MTVIYFFKNPGKGSMITNDSKIINNTIVKYGETWDVLRSQHDINISSSEGIQILKGTTLESHKHIDYPENG